MESGTPPFKLLKAIADLHQIKTLTADRPRRAQARELSQEKETLRARRTFRGVYLSERVITSEEAGGLSPRLRKPAGAPSSGRKADSYGRLGL